MHPLRQKPSKSFSKMLIALIWVMGLAFALPMSTLYTFSYVPDKEVSEKVWELTENDTNGTSAGKSAKQMKPFCYIEQGENITVAAGIAFKAYRWIFFPLNCRAYSATKIKHRELNSWKIAVFKFFKEELEHFLSSCLSGGLRLCLYGFEKRS